MDFANHERGKEGQLMKVGVLPGMDIPWFGQKSGYPLALDPLSRQPGLEVLVPHREIKPSPINRLRCRFPFHRLQPLPLYHRLSPLAEAYFEGFCQKQKVHAAHFMNFEATFGRSAQSEYFKQLPTIATVHQPVSFYRVHSRNAKHFPSIDHLIALSREVAQVVGELSRKPVHYIPHGVDTAFFTPPASDQKSTDVFRALTVGSHLRDFDMVFRVAARSLKKAPHYRFTLVVPRYRLVEPIFTKIARLDNTTILTHLSDDELLAQYHQAHIAFLPFIDCAANNAIVEAVSCGLPIVTTDMPSVRDYVDDAFGRFAPPNDFEGLCEHLHYFETRAHRETAALQARAHALKHFSWIEHAQRTVDVYRQAMA